jgi:hypothetical protein
MKGRKRTRGKNKNDTKEQRREYRTKYNENNQIIPFSRFGNGISVPSVLWKKNKNN